MSNNTTLRFDATVFNPELDETCIARNPVFHTSRFLTPADFTNTEFADNFLESLNLVSKALKAGFELTESTARVDKPQWLSATAQVMASIHEGIYRTFPLLSLAEYKAAFGPEESDAARNFSFAVGSLHYFLTNTAVNHPDNFTQCARCLKVSSTTTSAEQFNAHLQACNRDADATRLTVINATVKEACNEALCWKDVQAAHAQDQVVLAVINSDPPPFYADPRIEEWVRRLAEAKHLEAEATATAHAVEEARTVYEAQLALSQQSLTADL